jgi:ribonuclease Y
MLTVVAALIGIAVGAVGLWVWLRTVSTSRLRLAEDQRRSLLADAEREAETTRREAQIEARERAVQLRADLESELQDARVQMAKAEARVQQQESESEARSEALTRREQGIADREIHTRQLQEQLKAASDQMLRELERVGGLTLDDAKAQLLERSEDLVRHELARTVRQLDEEARTDAKR